MIQPCVHYTEAIRATVKFEITCGADEVWLKPEIKPTSVLAI